MAKSSKSVLLVSDMHVGSSTSICTQEPEIADLGTVHNPTKLQKELYSVWNECIDELHQKPDVLVINGEPCDGGNPKGLGKQSWSTNIQDQLIDAGKLVKKIPYKNLLITRGSGYHVDLQGTNFEEIFARQMDAGRYKAFGGSGFTDYYAIFDLNGKIFNCSHHVGFNKWASYRTTALSREMAGMVFEKGKMGRFDVLARSHVHYFVHVEFVHTHGIITPAWKYPDGHLFRGGVAGTTPDIGMVEVIVESNGEILVKKHIAEMDIKPLVRHY
jgi:hypothetical protein